MARLGEKLRSLEGGKVAFMCPGCRTMHAVRVEGQGRPLWGYNGDPDAPTFTPSVLVRMPDPDTGEDLLRCHSFVTDGKIRFLNDCTHELAGQVVDLPKVAA